MLMTKNSAADDHAAARLDTRVPSYVRVLNGTLHEDPNSPGGLVLQGQLDPATLRFIRVDSGYQRPLEERADIFDAYRTGKVVPPVDLGARGQDFVTEGENDYVIKSPVYAIDGAQRIGNAARYLELITGASVFLMATVHFGTEAKWEETRFTELNKNVRKVSPNLHLRNLRDANEAVLTMFGLSAATKAFPLYNRVCWSQNMARGDLIGAVAFVKPVITLHAQHTAMKNGTVEEIARALLRATKAVGLANFRGNVSAFYGLVNECWPIHAVEYRRAAPQLKSSFLIELARMFSRHACFWDERDQVLTLNADDRRKLAKFPIGDPQVLNLAGSGGKARNILYQLFVDHMNSGRRTQRLVSRFDREAQNGDA